MNEDYVSLEAARLLKEKGFDWYCDNRFVEKIPDTEREEWDDDKCAYVTKTKCNIYPKPTLYMAQKWLRSRGYAVEIAYMYGDCWIYEILTIPNHDLVGLADRKPTEYMSYEYALQAGIMEALKLI